jgi:hypothetical protein
MTFKFLSLLANKIAIRNFLISCVQGVPIDEIKMRYMYQVFRIHIHSNSSLW